MELTLIIGLATAFNLIIIYWKFNSGRTESAILDMVVFVGVGWAAGGTVTGISVAMIASACFSLFMAIMPPKSLTA